MRIRLDKIVISHFKRIEVLTIDLKPVTALVGGNTSGKSSALQAAQLGVSILQAALRNVKADGTPDFAGTVSNDNGDCQDFRVWPGIMGNKESHYVTTQRTCHTE